MANKNKVIDGKIWVAIAIHIIVFLVTIKLVNPKVKSSINMKYYLQKDYHSSNELVIALNKGDLFKWCCDCILYYAKKLGLSYEQLNIDVFVIMQPLLISCLFILLNIFSKKKDIFYKFQLVQSLFFITFLYCAFLFNLPDVEWQTKVAIDRVLFVLSGSLVISFNYYLAREFKFLKK